jgi:hypothetical protein
MPPEQRGALVAPREAVLEVDPRPDDPQSPLVGLAEQPVPLSPEVRPPLPAAAGKPARDADEDERNGTAHLCLCTAPRRGVRPVSVSAHKTAMDGATEVQQRLDLPYPEAERSRLVCDHLHTPGIGSL